MDEFEVELRITQLEKAYAIASNALHRARITLQALRSEPATSAVLLARAEKRCEELVRRKDGLRFALEELETQTEPAPRTRGSKRAAQLHHDPDQ